MKIVVHNETQTKLSFVKTLKRLFDSISNDKVMHIIIVDEETIQQMNNYYRKIDAVTDVLSFESDEEDSIGDIFICLKRAKEQAYDYYHSTRREVAFLSIHGYLHLIGYDHDTPKKEKIMMDLTKSLLEQGLTVKKEK